MIIRYNPRTVKMLGNLLPRQAFLPTAYVTRQSVQSVPAIRKAKKAIRKAFENSMNGKGSNLVEIVSTCSSGWKMTPEKANKWMEEHMFPFYPLGDLKDKE